MFDLIEENYYFDTSSLMASKLLHVLSTIRLLHVVKLARFFLELESVSHIRLAALRRLFRPVCVILVVFLITHWNACIQFFICALGEFPPDSWVMQENLIDVMEFMCPNVMKGRMFASGDVKLIEAVLMKLDCEIFQAGDIIICQNSLADRMYFIEVGRVLQETEFIQKELSCGENTLEVVYEKLAVLIQFEESSPAARTLPRLAS
ncbi:putative potassium/sodium hyperpolarization-activated cyclic nucleotide-gated channel 1-like [Triplophysa rosa]|uniref:Potassium/sodium hyperpolarization-activated cyclic nucleotide-gated channel 1-like n=1 Tax=Triplophysa rosa TaxID=992332 RepID=A0A9W7T2S4_TRIRA|nr:putative potassium/sodium hyperpolarization-activated cyclic nucleotide-gated channel 1-like [Triplophysa rosa]